MGLFNTITHVIDEPPHLTIGPLMIWIHRREFPFVDDWCERNWLMSTCSLRVGSKSFALSGADAASDELSHLLETLQQLRDGEVQTVGYYPSSQTVLIDIEQVDTDHFALVLTHLNGSRVACDATRLDVERWIFELQGILHIFPRIFSETPIGQPYVSPRCRSTSPPSLTKQLYRELPCPSLPDVCMPLALPREASTPTRGFASCCAFGAHLGRRQRRMRKAGFPRFALPCAMAISASTGRVSRSPRSNALSDRFMRKCIASILSPTSPKAGIMCVPRHQQMMRRPVYLQIVWPRRPPGTDARSFSSMKSSLLIRMSSILRSP
ncbi:hypothetical protein SAMN05660710_03784 [Paracoccus tibetensis]|uniref:Uncharacterized protein n=1 Tax=Paracoccus tibetensis TaxID=336292 RepID=A0A1G5KA80_9RHOB|nr:hypothetical protein SAMN05660710_03784 [Paracoccus tibetensis]